MYVIYVYMNKIITKLLLNVSKFADPDLVIFFCQLGTFRGSLLILNNIMLSSLRGGGTSGGRG